MAKAQPWTCWGISAAASICACDRCGLGIGSNKSIPPLMPFLKCQQQRWLSFCFL